MPVDPFAVLNAMLRAEAARHDRTARPARAPRATESESERSRFQESPSEAAPAREAAAGR
ncbi:MULTISPECIES: hypothetical protein [Streptomyces]|uniref:hypothetical protein n=1 Tax=Streptomyces TaxID=1883 RepID=UPI001318742A|nr:MULTISPECIES: hypothetical protein [Streptomyces]QGZ51807.1 hypothetical protein GPZ77_28555 [Streptomyces sp. QHH-9511]GGT96119.1 hypothetical protein GCM10010272_46150 [Streptomyces lateritius]